MIMWWATMWASIDNTFKKTSYFNIIPLRCPHLYTLTSLSTSLLEKSQYLKLRYYHQYIGNCQEPLAVYPRTSLISVPYADIIPADICHYTARYGLVIPMDYLNDSSHGHQICMQYHCMLIGTWFIPTVNSRYERKWTILFIEWIKVNHLFFLS